MSRRRSCELLTLSIIFFLGLSALAEAAGPPPGFSKAKQAYQKALRSKTEADRIAAFSKLADFPGEDAVELICKSALSDPSLKVKQAAREALLKFQGHADVANSLFKMLQLSTRKEGMNQTTYDLLWVLTGFPDTETKNAVVSYLDNTLESDKADLFVIFNLIDDFAQQADDHAVQALELLSRAKLFNTSFGYRRAIVQAMVSLRKNGAVAFLVKTLPSSKGLIQYDIIQHLTNVTKQKFRDDEKAWQKWWDGAAATFQFPPAKDLVADASINDKDPTYYGIPICAKRIVFVMDTSGSMRGEAIETAKRELVKTLQALPPEVHFSMVMFDRSVRVWQPRMVAATTGFRDLASQTVMGQELAAGTASMAALKAAFALEPEAIYFLSDGAPTDSTPADIVNVISRENKIRRISVHAIGIGTDKKGIAIFKQFMQALSGYNWGKYHGVDL